MRAMKRRSRREQRSSGRRRWERRGEEGTARKRARDTGKKNLKSAKSSRKRRRGFGAMGRVRVWMKKETALSRSWMRRNNGGAAGGDFGGPWPWPIGVTEGVIENVGTHGNSNDRKRLVRISSVRFGFLRFP